MERWRQYVLYRYYRYLTPIHVAQIQDDKKYLRNSLHDADEKLKMKTGLEFNT